MLKNVNKQIEYWINTGEEDLNSAELLIKNNKNLHGLFFCHLCIEKAIKAHVARCTFEVPPKSDNLSYLLSKTDLKLSEEYKDFCAILMTYQLEGRYPENLPSSPTNNVTIKYLYETKSLFQWLKEKL